MNGLVCLTEEERRQRQNVKAVRGRLMGVRPRPALAPPAAAEAPPAPAVAAMPVAAEAPARRKRGVFLQPPPEPEWMTNPVQQDDHMREWRAYIARKPHRMRNYAARRARDFGFTWQAVRSPRCDKALVEARHQIMWEVWRKFDASLPAIGRLFNRDHTTVLYAVRKIEARQRDASAFVIACPQCLGEGYLHGGIRCGICLGNGEISAVTAREYALECRDAAEQQGPGALEMMGRKKLMERAAAVFRALGEAPPWGGWPENDEQEGGRDD